MDTSLCSGIRACICILEADKYPREAGHQPPPQPPMPWLMYPAHNQHSHIQYIHTYAQCIRIHASIDQTNN